MQAAEDLHMIGVHGLTLKDSLFQGPVAPYSSNQRTAERAIRKCRHVSPVGGILTVTWLFGRHDYKSFMI